MVFMERLFSVRDSFWADAVDHSDRGRTFYPDETLWWDTELTSDPAVFQVGSFRFQVPRSEFLMCIRVLTAENFRRHQQILNSPSDSIEI
jgi:hypothetical protein